MDGSSNDDISKDGVEAYLAKERIRDRGCKRSKHILIKWEGFERRTWEPLANIRDTMNDDVI